MITPPPACALLLLLLFEPVTLEVEKQIPMTIDDDNVRDYNENSKA